MVFEGLRYNKVIVATDADVDGMHIRLLLITFFLQFFPDLIKKGHVYILQTPLFRVRNKKKTNYCYSEEERINAINELGPNPEITRFKGLGEISPDEFKHFIGKDMRLEQVTLRKTDAVKELLEFGTGKNTMERQNFIIDNLVIEEDWHHEKSNIPGYFRPFHHRTLLGSGTCTLPFMDEIVIGIGINENKNTYFPIEKREEMIRELYKDEPRIQVMSYDCLTIDFAQK